MTNAGAVKHVRTITARATEALTLPSTPQARSMAAAISPVLTASPAGDAGQPGERRAPGCDADLQDHGSENDARQHLFTTEHEHDRERDRQHDRYGHEGPHRQCHLPQASVLRIEQPGG